MVAQLDQDWPVFVTDVTDIPSALRMVRDLGQVTGKTAEGEALACKIAAAMAGLQGCDAVMLAQFSMAAAQPLAQQCSAVPVLSSPDCAVTELRRKMIHD